MLRRAACTCLSCGSFRRRRHPSRRHRGARTTISKAQLEPGPAPRPGSYPSVSRAWKSPRSSPPESVAAPPGRSPPALPRSWSARTRRRLGPDPGLREKLQQTRGLPRRLEDQHRRLPPQLHVHCRGGHHYSGRTRPCHMCYGEGGGKRGDYGACGGGSCEYVRWCGQRSGGGTTADEDLELGWDRRVALLHVLLAAQVFGGDGLSNSRRDREARGGAEACGNVGENECAREGGGGVSRRKGRGGGRPGTNLHPCRN